MTVTVPIAIEHSRAGDGVGLAATAGVARAPGTTSPCSWLAGGSDGGVLRK